MVRRTSWTRLPASLSTATRVTTWPSSRSGANITFTYGIRVLPGRSTRSHSPTGRFEPSLSQPVRTLPSMAAHGLRPVELIPAIAYGSATEEEALMPAMPWYSATAVSSSQPFSSRSRALTPPKSALLPAVSVGDRFVLISPKERSRSRSASLTTVGASRVPASPFTRTGASPSRPRSPIASSESGPPRTATASAAACTETRSLLPATSYRSSAGNGASSWLTASSVSLSPTGSPNERTFVSPGVSRSASCTRDGQAPWRFCLIRSFLTSR